jgi:aminoglycoside/choline kinase family phosphotransferase
MKNMKNFSCLRDWVERHLPSFVALDETIQLNQLNGDAGFRQYFRVNSKPSLIAVLAPPLLEDSSLFVSIALCFKKNSLHVPVIYAVNYESGFLLLEDFGDDVLLPLLTEKDFNDLYDSAEVELIKIQKIPINNTIFPVYNRLRLLEEMSMFTEWFVKKLLNVELNIIDLRLLDDAFSTIVDSALEQTQVVVHRDFHSRNLMKLTNGAIGVIDFQDAVIGPITYDMVSLLRDCYVRLPEKYVVQRALAYYRLAVVEGVTSQASDEQVVDWFDLMGLQRHIKVLGIFSRLYLRDGKHRYLDDLPLVVRYMMEQLKSQPKLKEFALWFEQRLLPQISRESWYKPWEAAGEIPEKRN